MRRTRSARDGLSRGTGPQAGASRSPDRTEATHLWAADRRPDLAPREPFRRSATGGLISQRCRSNYDFDGRSVGTPSRRRPRGSCTAVERAREQVAHKRAKLQSRPDVLVDLPAWRTQATDRAADRLAQELAGHGLELAELRERLPGMTSLSQGDCQAISGMIDRLDDPNRGPTATGSRRTSRRGRRSNDSGRQSSGSG